MTAGSPRLLALIIYNMENPNITEYSSNVSYKIELAFLKRHTPGLQTRHDPRAPDR